MRWRSIRQHHNVRDESEQHRIRRPELADKTLEQLLANQSALWTDAIKRLSEQRAATPPLLFGPADVSPEWELRKLWNSTRLWWRSQFKEKFNTAAHAVWSAGWLLKTGETENHLTVIRTARLWKGKTPILGLERLGDAYYLHYQNRRRSTLAHLEQVNWKKSRTHSGPDRG